MVRAIDMEKDIDMLKAEVERLNNIIRGMSSELTEVTEVLFEEEEEIKEEKKDGKKKANSKGSGSNSKRGDAKNGNTKNKNDKSGDSSK